MNRTQDDFLLCYLRTQDDLRAYIHSALRDQHLAEDVFQEVSLVLWHKFDQFDPERGAFGAWAYGIASREVYRQSHRQRRGGAVLSPEALTALADATEDLAEEQPYADQLVALERCLDKLDGHAHRLLTLRYGQSLSLQEIAEATRRGAEAVGKAMQRLRRALADCVDRQGVPKT